MKYEASTVIISALKYIKTFKLPALHPEKDPYLRNKEPQ